MSRGLAALGRGVRGRGVDLLVPRPEGHRLPRQRPLLREYFIANIFVQSH